MIVKKHSYYKPLYKQILNLRENVQNRKKLLKFKKQKWQKLIHYLNKAVVKSRKAKIKMNGSTFYHKNYFRNFNQHSYHIPRFTKFFTRKFKDNLLSKQRFQLFYGGLSEKFIKSVIKKSLTKSNVSKINLNPSFFLTEFLERRLDSILFRSHFVLSFRNARQLISHGHVLVNGKVTKKKGLLLKEGDTVGFSKKIHSLIKSYIGNSEIWPIPPKYLQINYRILQIMIVDDVKHTSPSTNFPFWLNLNGIINRYTN